MQNEKILTAKKEIIEMLCDKLQNTLQDIQNHFEAVKQRAIEAPGRMQSRYDSEKQELSYLADALLDRIKRLQQEIIILKQHHISVAAEEETGIGSLVIIMSKSENEKLYLILPAGGGEIIKSKILEKEITIISHYSPLGKILLGKTIGDIIQLRAQQLTVTDIL